MRKKSAIWLVLLAGLSVAGCGSGKEATPSPVCDQKCVDGVALRAVRETLKLAYNLTLQGDAVGAVSGETACPDGGKVAVAGVATSNSVQGATEVDLVFVFDACSYKRQSSEPEKSYDLVISGSIHEKGTLAVQPTATTALLLSSDALTLTGEVYDPALPYDATACTLKASQSGNEVSGTLCERNARFSF